MNLEGNWEVEKIISEVVIRNDLISKEQLTVIREHNGAGGIAVWGTGRAGSYAVNYLLKNDIHPVCVTDSFDHAEGSEFEGIPLLSAQNFFARFPNALVIMACLYVHGVDKLLKEKGYHYLTFDTTLLNQCIAPISYQEYIKEGREGIDEVYALLADEVSKFTYEQLIKYRLSFDRKYINSINQQHIYFGNDVVPSFSGKTFVDCGAFTGDTLLDFFNSKSCWCESYYALEPSHKNFGYLQEMIRSHNITWAVPLEVGAWDREDTLRFSDNLSMSSSVSQMGETTINVDSLDHLLSSKNINFIKMDIEGAEKQAILGAKSIIQEQNPILALSIYHKPEDFWELPLLIKSINKKCRMYIRHHTSYSADTVLYCVPE